MAVDKLVDSTQLDSDLTSVANAIRTKGGTSAALAFPAEFVSAIENIPSGGGLTLLNSGTYTSTVEGALSIPVSYTGTPKLVCVNIEEVLSGVSHSCQAVCYMNDIPDVVNSNLRVANKGFSNVRVRNQNGNYTFLNAASASAISLSSTTLSVANGNSSYKWKTAKYDWYIYG